MTHDNAFRRDIIENPDDDTPRLVYADWLDEHGQPERAEFIRVQCELARMPAGDPRRAELEARERELLYRRRSGIDCHRYADSLPTLSRVISACYARWNLW
jgi:uncharacterized protein (TIGR02996 family)